MALAVDISNHQKLLTPAIVADWQAAGVSKVIIRASTEDDGKVAIAKQQMMTVIDAGLPVEAYVWLYFAEDDPAAEQMRRAFNAYANMPVGYWWLDCEDEPYVAEEDTVLAIGEALAAFGDKPVGIYTSLGWWLKATGNTNFFKNYTLWLASWGPKPSRLDLAHSFGGWQQAVMVQYVADTVLGGKTVDLNVYES